MTQALNSKNKSYIGAKKFLGDDVRKVFDSLAGATSALKGIYALPEFPTAFPIVVAGVGSIDISGDDSIPPYASWSDEARAVYESEGVRVALAFIGVRNMKDPTDPEGRKEINGARGFVVYPMPSLTAIRSSERGEGWLLKVAEKEASHVALRGIRNVPDTLGIEALAAAAMEMPLTVEDFVEGSTSEALDTAAFDGLWKDFRKMLSEDSATAALVTALPPKSEVIKAIRSSAYAVANFPDLESMGAFAFIGGTMADVMDHLRQQADEAGVESVHNSSELRAWVATRDTFVFQTKAKAPVDLTQINLSGFGKALLGTASTTAPELETKE